MRNIIIKEKDDFIHFLNLQRWNKFHVKISLNDLIPKKVIGTHREYYDVLVMGYVKGNESKLRFNVPFALKKMALKFLSLFD